MPPAKNPVKTTRLTLSLVSEIESNGPGRVTELADRLDVSKSAVHNHLSTLEEEGYVVKEEKEYRLGLKFLQIGGRIRDNMDLYRAAKPEMQNLAQETGELTTLMTEENAKGVYIYRFKGEQGIDLNTYIGMRDYLHSTALGKAILAFLPEDRVREIISRHGLPEMTEETITDPEKLLSTLDEIQERGYAIDDEEWTEGVRCIAAPIVVDDQVYGSLSVSAPISRMKDEQLQTEWTERIIAATNVVELNIKHSR